MSHFSLQNSPISYMHQSPVCSWYRLTPQVRCSSSCYVGRGTWVHPKFQGPCFPLPPSLEHAGARLGRSGCGGLPAGYSCWWPGTLPRCLQDTGQNGTFSWIFIWDMYMLVARCYTYSTYVLNVLYICTYYVPIRMCCIYCIYYMYVRM